jgi:ATP-binding cassette subfamily C (CFTR/MRP) protein 4
MYASWSKEDTTTCTDEESTGFSLSNISFTCDSGHLVAVVGATGSGKSSLLMALMREMETIRGGINVLGSLFYVAQEPWIFTSTLKQNILFGKDYDEEKFERVIKACSLDKDIMVMAEGCETIIGEKGINLSGGQRARVSLARALYYDAQVYLIDDPLSAVDTNVAKQIFENCINGYLKSKIKILVTHHVQHLEHADQILILNDGEIVESGKYDELLKKGINLSSYLSSCNTSGNISTTKAIAGGVSSNKPCVSLLPMIDLDSAKRTPSIKNKDTNATTLADSFKIQFTNGSISTLNTLFELEKLLPSLEIQSESYCLFF